MDSYVDLIGLVATILYCVFVSSNVKGYLKVRAQRKVISEVGLWLVVSLQSLLIATIYGIQIRDLYYTVASAFGLVCLLFYVLTLMQYGQDRIVMDNALLFMSILITVFFLVLAFAIPDDKQLAYLSTVNLVFNIALTVFLLQPIIVSLKNKKNFNPPLFTVFGIVNSSVWIYYGFLVDNFVVWAPAALSVAMRCVQFFQIVYYRIRNGPTQPELTVTQSQESLLVTVEGTSVSIPMCEEQEALDKMLASPLVSMTKIDRSISVINFSMLDQMEPSSVPEFVPSVLSQSANIERSISVINFSLLDV
ncbi:hypothetical protein RCL1_003053 [Eukaryota sp. TZLM3-RCL]